MRKMLPKQVWRKLRDEALEQERARREEEDAKLPRTRLEARHVQHLQMLVDRGALLKLLPPNAVAAEIGVDKGDFTQQILEVAKPAKLHLVDSWGSERYHEGKKLAIEEKFNELVAAGKLVINRGLSTDELAKFEDVYFDWVYIDTNHKYGTTRDELALARQKVKPGGIIAGHDFTVGNWIKGIRYGVIEAVREFCLKFDWEFVYQTCEAHDNHSFALRRIV